MNLEKIAIENDIYLYNWIYHLKPILVRNNTYQKFIEANHWVKVSKEQQICNTQWHIHFGNPLDYPFSAFFNTLIRFFWLRKTLKTYQKLGYPKGIQITENMLKFHNNDSREAIRDRILEKNFDK